MEGAQAKAVPIGASHLPAERTVAEFRTGSRQLLELLANATSKSVEEIYRGYLERNLSIRFNALLIDEPLLRTYLGGSHLTPKFFTMFNPHHLARLESGLIASCNIGFVILVQIRNGHQIFKIYDSRLRRSLLGKESVDRTIFIKVTKKKGTPGAMKNHDFGVTLSLWNDPPSKLFTYSYLIRRGKLIQGKCYLRAAQSLVVEPSKRIHIPSDLSPVTNAGEIATRAEDFKKYLGNMGLIFTVHEGTTLAASSQVWVNERLENLTSQRLYVIATIYNYDTVCTVKDWYSAIAFLITEDGLALLDTPFASLVKSNNCTAAGGKKEDWKQIPVEDAKHLLRRGQGMQVTKKRTNGEERDPGPSSKIRKKVDASKRIKKGGTFRYTIKKSNFGVPHTIPPLTDLQLNSNLRNPDRGGHSHNWPCNCSLCKAAPRTYGKNMDFLGGQKLYKTSLTAFQLMTYLNLDTESNFKLLREALNASLIAFDVEAFTNIPEETADSVVSPGLHTKGISKGGLIGKQPLYCIGVAHGFENISSEELDSFHFKQFTVEEGKTPLSAVEQFYDHLEDVLEIQRTKKLELLSSLRTYVMALRDKHMEFWTSKDNSIKGQENDMEAIQKSARCQLFGKLLEKLNKICHRSIVLGHNASRYDYPQIISYLSTVIKSRSAKTKLKIVKNGNSINKITVGSKFTFIDTMDLVPFTSLKKFASLAGVTSCQKGLFPHNGFKDRNFLERTTMPIDPESYTSIFDGSRPDDGEIQRAVEDYAEHGFQNLGEYLTHYLKVRSNLGPIFEGS